ncbi:DUF305 domain-containing protein [Cryobacterium sp. TMS1-20-1]|uniref:DUF305 domain-containing protein n=1 Tax=Cryobacterium sp. TMS1-20-1 TaxID=1259223 RepID=UPI00106CA02B|nr:DUF305 domain-containing protein [Cryobacterium sp. TMS1-20-1]TFC71335.1 DUF305 domain-containing protein [Cryobacterium sp. TMS1-20-1]
MPARPADAPPSRPRRTLIRAIAASVLVTALVVGAVAFSIGRLSTIVDATPETTSAEAGFARDMQEHHNQGVELALIIRDRTDDEPVRLLAYDIATTQAKQSGQMSGWLAVWGLPQFAPEPSMTWMTRPGLSGETHDGPHTAGSDAVHVAGDPMPGLATPAQIAALTAASGVEAEREFLVIMIAHHQGAIEMAEAVLDRSTNATVQSFATSVVLSQESEIDLMTGMLADRS